MDNFYTVTVYNKGAEVIRMYRTLLGYDGFRKGMDLYFERHDGSAVTCDDFRAAMADANGYDLQQFERWYTQAGTPTITLSKKQVANGKVEVELSQNTADTPGQAAAEKEPFHVPVACALFDRRTGAKVADQLFSLRAGRQTFAFDAAVDGAADDYVVSLLRGFSAPVVAAQEPKLSSADLLFLAANDDDPANRPSGVARRPSRRRQPTLPKWTSSLRIRSRAQVNRWDAAQQIYSRAVLDAFSGAATASASLEAATAAFKAALDDTEGDPSLRALNLALPGFSELGLKLDDGFDPVALCAAGKAVRKHLATACASELGAVYASLASDAPFDVEAASVGRRRLRNACLANLARVDGGFKAGAAAHYGAANCMTDELAAAVALAGEASPERDEVLSKFYGKVREPRAGIDATSTETSAVAAARLRGTSPRRGRGGAAIQSPRTVHVAASPLFRLHGLSTWRSRRRS